MPGEITITFETLPGVSYDVYCSDSLEGTYSIVSTVEAPGDVTTWVDDGTETSAHPYEVDERYYKIAIHNSTLFSYDTVGQFMVDIFSSGAPNSLTDVALPFEQYDNSMDAVFGGQGHTGSPAIPPFCDKLNKFNPATQEFDIVFWKSPNGWAQLGTTEPVTLAADEGFIYTNVKSTSQEIWFVGRASPGDRSIPIAGTAGDIKLVCIGSSYPISVSMQDSNLIESGFTGGFIPPFSDMVNEFNLSTGEYTHVAWYNSSTSTWLFINPGDPFVLEPARAYIISNKDNSTPVDWTWTYAKPYDEPPND